MDVPAGVKFPDIASYQRLAGEMDAIGHAVPFPEVLALRLSSVCFTFFAVNHESKNPVDLLEIAVGRDLYDILFGPLHIVTEAPTE